MRVPKIAAAIKKSNPGFFGSYNLVVAPVHGTDLIYVRIESKRQQVVFVDEIEDATDEEIAEAITSKV